MVDAARNRGPRRYHRKRMPLDSRKLRAAIALFVLLFALPATAGDPPHYMSVRKGEAFLRQGPSYKHRILWVYRHRDYPLEVVASFDVWRKVKDIDGVTGWMHHTQLSDRRTVLFVGRKRSPIREDDAPEAKIVAYAQPGVVAKLKACELAVCEVEASGTVGWVDKRNIWGAGAREVFQ
jgi:SH3-like domain-containing protein